MMNKEVIYLPSEIGQQYANAAEALYILDKMEFEYGQNVVAKYKDPKGNSQVIIACGISSGIGRYSIVSSHGLKLVAGIITDDDPGHADVGYTVEGEVWVWYTEGKYYWVTFDNPDIYGGNPGNRVVTEITEKVIVVTYSGQVYYINPSHGLVDFFELYTKEEIQILIQGVDDKYRQRILDLEKAVFPLRITFQPTTDPVVFKKGTTGNSFNANISVLRKEMDVSEECTLKVNSNLVSPGLNLFGSSYNSCTEKTYPGSIVNDKQVFGLSVLYPDYETLVFKYLPVYYVNPTVSARISAADPSLASLLSLLESGQGQVRERGNSDTRTFTLSNQRLVYLYPESFGPLKAILDENGFDYLSDYTCQLTTTNFYNSEKYYIYIKIDATTITNFKQIYVWQ